MVSFPDELREAHAQITEDKCRSLIDNGVGSTEKKALGDMVLEVFRTVQPELYEMMKEEGPSVIVQLLTDRWVQTRKGKLRAKDEEYGGEELESRQRLFHLIPNGDEWELKYILDITRQEAAELASEYDKRVRRNRAPRNWWNAVVNYMLDHGFAPHATLGEAFYVASGTDTEEEEAA